ncbi:ABC transporter ATP-binding protein [Halalkalibacterium halodurans]|uniref:ABC transporter ATP-binding protein n=1 Tax=Halalkalibacterium halodurans TaxID=86665 RepID=UPI002AA9F0AE|nr:ABC transporter ATP-binding protein [Halalkalibacterium halodurans]MDY7221693.1 ABC transporter ATP-binding protein [Halalkalibacterium halodurans]MDY7240969.1 ABC transporter ATP-binding protein [Halalkalibacterium halodurans]
MSLTIDGVTKKFGTFTAVNNLHVSVPKGEMFGMLGANGAGKTTTFRMILGLLEPTEGTIHWREQPLTYKRTNCIGYLPEERGLYPKLTVKEQLKYLGRLKGMKTQDIQKEMKMWLERFEVPEYEHKRVEQLSKGNQQKIQFIASVLHRPELLILDEPFSGLDPVNVELLKKAVIDLKKEGTTILFSSHRMEHVEELCQHLCILHRGSPIVEGNLKDIKRSFGKKNVIIQGEFALEPLVDIPGVLRHQETSAGAKFQIANEETAKLLFQAVATAGFVQKFELEEPSLHDIFVEKVGTRYE